MNSLRKTVFISCGQYTPEERQLGKRVCELVDECTPFAGYFADNQTTLKALSENVLTRLYESVGLIVIMHHRGKVQDRDVIRASVWIEQEVAMATLMEQVLHRPLHVALFVERGIAIEGIRQQLQLNSIEFTNGDEVTARLRELLATWTEPLYIGDDERRALVESVDLSVAVKYGHNFNLTIFMENHSKIDVEVQSIVVCCKKTRLSKPVYPTAGSRWLVPAGRSFPLQFPTDEDVAGRLTRIYGQPPVADTTPLAVFTAEVTVELRCEILGLVKTFKENSVVEVSLRNRQITGL